MTSPATHAPTPIHHHSSSSIPSPRRTFGYKPPQPAFPTSQSNPNLNLNLSSPIPQRPSSSASSHSSSTINVTTGQSPYLHAPEPQRTRSASSASTEAFETAATKAQAWLSTWSPYKGEGRGREFLSNTLNGVAGVANTVSHGINGAVTKGVQLSAEGRKGMNRPASFSAAGANEPIYPSGSALATSPPEPTHTASMSAIPTASTAKKPPQPANFSRLGPQISPPLEQQSLRPPLGHPTSSPANPNGHRRASSTAQGLAHGSMLNPNHVRTGSTSHTRSPSFGAAMVTSLSRSSSTATGGRSLTGKSQGMPYKIGFQPAGVRSDRSEEFQDARRAAGEERDKEEGRLGRRWAKVSFTLLFFDAWKLTFSSSTYISTRLKVRHRPYLP